MKRKYVTPVMESEDFVANEYIAACFAGVCNIPNGFYHFIYKDTNNSGGPDSGDTCLADFNDAEKVYPDRFNAFSYCGFVSGVVKSEEEVTAEPNAYLVRGIATTDENGIKTWSPDFTRSQEVFVWENTDPDAKPWHQYHYLDWINKEYRTNPNAS